MQVALLGQNAEYLEIGLGVLLGGVERSAYLAGFTVAGGPAQVPAGRGARPRAVVRRDPAHLAALTAR